MCSSVNCTVRLLACTFTVLSHLPHCPSCCSSSCCIPRTMSNQNNTSSPKFSKNGNDSPINTTPTNTSNNKLIVPTLHASRQLCSRCFHTLPLALLYILVESTCTKVTPNVSYLVSDIRCNAVKRRRTGPCGCMLLGQLVLFAECFGMICIWTKTQQTGHCS